MMSVIVPYFQLADIAENGIPATFVGPFIRLFTNNLTPDPTDLVGAFTECTDAGYAAIPLSAWPSAIFAVDRATFTFPGVLFGPFAGANNIYGYFVTDSTGADLYWSERAVSPVPPIVTSFGSGLTVVAKVSQSCPIP